MDRRRATLVMAVLAALLAASCLEVDIMAPDLPRPVYIDTAFSDEEVAAIQASMAEWDAMSMECLGVPAFEYLGRYEDPDGFQLEDMLDDRAIIYRLSNDSEAYKFLESQEMYKNRGLGGYATLGDVLMFMEEGDTIETFQPCVLHELGHHLGLLHIMDDPGAVMDMDVGSDHLTEIDREAFYIVHDCHCD